MNLKKIAIYSLAALGVILIAWALLTFKSGYIVLTWAIFGDAFPKTGVIIFVITLFIGCLIFYLTTKNKLAKDILTAICMAAGNWFIIYTLYFSFIYETIVLRYGANPTAVQAIMCLMIVPSVGVFYWAVFSHFDVKIKIWPAYLLISIFGPIVVGIGAYMQPYQLFDHVVINEQGRVAKKEMESYYYDIDTNKQTAMKGVYPIRSKFWILWDTNDNIIDHSSSPGVSARYGREFVRGTPSDVDEYVAYLRTKSKLRRFYQLIDQSKIQAKVEKATTKKECTDCELLYPGQIKVVVLRNGEKPKKYLRLPSTGYPFKIGRSLDQTNFCIKTRTGLIIPFSKIRTSNIFLDHRDFMIIPTNKNKVKIGIKT